MTATADRARVLRADAGTATSRGTRSEWTRKWTVALRPAGSVACPPCRCSAPSSSPAERVPRLVAGLVLCGLGIAFMVAADLGLAPWSVLDQGISQHTGIPIGTVSIIVGASCCSPGCRCASGPGLGTVLNVLLIGTTIDVALLVLDTPGLARSAASPTWRSACSCGARARGLYIGAGLGPGPRDGLMTGLAARGVGSIRLVRTGIELTALATGWLLGGSVGPRHAGLRRDHRPARPVLPAPPHGRRPPVGAVGADGVRRQGCPRSRPAVEG